MSSAPRARGHATASVAAILAESAARHPDDVAVIVGPQRTTYAELWQQTLAYAGALRARGVGEGDRVAMLVPNVADFPRVYYAMLALGAVAVPIHALLKHHEIEYVLRDSGSTLLVCAAPLLAEGAAGAASAGSTSSPCSRRPTPRRAAAAAASRQRPRPPRSARRGRRADRHLRAARPVRHRDDPLHERHDRPAEGRRGLALRAARAGQREPDDHVRHDPRRRAARCPAPVPHLRPDLHDEHRRSGPARPSSWCRSSTATRRSRAMVEQRLRDLHGRARRCTWRCSTPRPAPRRVRRCATRSRAAPPCRSRSSSVPRRSSAPRSTRATA